MGRLDIILDDNLENKFRQSFDTIKKGQISKKISELIEKDLQIKKISNSLSVPDQANKFIREVDKMVSSWRDRMEFSTMASKKAIQDWKSLKKKYNIL